MSASVGSDCTELKQKYDSCFNDWYANKFLKGVATVNECEDTFVDYKACVMKALREKKIDVMLDEARREAPFEKGGKFNSGI